LPEINPGQAVTPNKGLPRTNCCGLLEWDCYRRDAFLSPNKLTVSNGRKRRHFISCKLQ